jgi:hypothetical protein
MILDSRPNSEITKSMRALSSRVLLSLTSLLPGLQLHVKPPVVLIFAVAAILATPAPVCAADLEAAPPPAKPAVREVSPGVFEIGKVRLDQKARSISFPGVLKMKRGLLEYLLVNPKGSVHESLLVTDVEANEIHVAMLLLGAKGGAVTAAAPPARLDAEYFRAAPKLTGDPVLISVKWKEKDEEKNLPIEDWLFNESAKKEIVRGPWIYNGSMLHEGRFLAQAEGNLVALVTSPTALVNNPRKGNDNDQMWNVNGETTPGVGTPVEIIIKLVPPEDANPSKQ